MDISSTCKPLLAMRAGAELSCCLCELIVSPSQGLKHVCRERHGTQHVLQRFRRET